MMSNKSSRLFDYIYIARQPIFDNTGSIWGYELLFRNGLDKQEAEITDLDIATLYVSTCGFIQSQAYSDGKKKICINFTEKLILDGTPWGLPPSVTVIEIHENIRSTPELISVIRELKQEGYLLSIEFSGDTEPPTDLLNFADVIKIGIQGKTFQEIQSVFSTVSHYKAIKIAEKVEQRNTITSLRAMGCDLYQGNFFAKPVNLRGRMLKQVEVSKLQILKAIENPSLNENDLVAIISADPGITYRLLQFMNSASFGFLTKVGSIKHAVRLIGTKRLKYWLRMVVLSELSCTNDMPELYLMSLARGRFFEEVVKSDRMVTASPETMFLFGLLSLIETMLEVSIDKILDQLPLSDELKSGYTDCNSTFGKYLQLAEALENSNAATIRRLCREMGLSEKTVAVASKMALAWTNTIFQSMI